MAEKIGEAILELKTDTKKLVKGMSKAQKAAADSMNKMQARADKFAKFMKGALGLGGVVLVFNKLKNVVGDLVAAYGVQETAETKLRAAIKASGKEASISADALFEYASELQGVTTYGDEATISALAMLQQLADLNEEGLKETIPLIQDFAAAMKVDLDTAATLVGKTLGSSTNALSRYGLEIDMTGTKQEKLISLTDAMQAKFGGMARELADTATGSLQQYNNALGDIKEFGGKAFLEFMQPAIQEMTIFLTRTLQSWQAQRNLNKALKGNASTLQDAKDAFQESQLRLNKLNDELKLAEKRSKDANVQNLKLGGTLRDNTAGLKKLVEQEQEQNDMLFQQMKLMAKEEKIRSANIVITLAQIETTETETEAQEALTIALEDHMSAAEALSIAAAEAYLIEKEAAEAALEAADELLKKKEEEVAFITGPFVDAYSDAFGKFGEILVEGGNAWDAFREAFKESIAGLLDAIGQKLLIMAGEALIPLPVLWNPVGAGLAFAGAAAAFTSAGVVRSLSEGGDFIVPPGYENDSYPMRVESGERVTVTPAAQAAQGGGQMIHVTFNLGSRTLYDDFSRATANGELIVHPRSIRK